MKPRNNISVEACHYRQGTDDRDDHIDVKSLGYSGRPTLSPPEKPEYGSREEAALHAPPAWEMIAM